MNEVGCGKIVCRGALVFVKDSAMECFVNISANRQHIKRQCRTNTPLRGDVLWVLSES